MHAHARMHERRRQKRLHLPVCCHDYPLISHLGCRQRPGASHSKYLQRPPSVPHFLAHFRHHGRADVCWKVLQGKTMRKNFKATPLYYSNNFFFHIYLYYILTVSPRRYLFR